MEAQKDASKLTSWAGRAVKKAIREHLGDDAKEGEDEVGDEEEKEVQAAIQASIVGGLEEAIGDDRGLGVYLSIFAGG